MGVDIEVWRATRIPAFWLVRGSIAWAVFGVSRRNCLRPGRPFRQQDQVWHHRRPSLAPVWADWLFDPISFCCQAAGRQAALLVLHCSGWPLVLRSALWKAHSKTAGFMWRQGRWRGSNSSFISRLPPLAAASHRDIYLFKDTSILPQHGVIETAWRADVHPFRRAGICFRSARAQSRITKRRSHSDWPVCVSLPRKAEKLMAEPVCPYCRMPFDEASPPQIFCTACGMPHHEDCYQENGGCTVFGCKRAPADDPKLQVSQSDLSAVSVAGPAVRPCCAAVCSVVPQPAPVQGINRRVTVGRWVCRKQLLPRPRRFQSLCLHLCAQHTLAAPSMGRAQEPHKLHCSWYFSWRAWNTQFLCGYTGRAVGQLCLTVLTLGYLGIISWVWAIIEICIVEKGQHWSEFQLNDTGEK